MQVGRINQLLNRTAEYREYNCADADTRIPVWLEKEEWETVVYGCTTLKVLNKIKEQTGVKYEDESPKETA